MNGWEHWGWWVGVLLAAFILFGNQGFRAVVSDWEEKRRVEKAILTLTQNHERLLHELTLLQNDAGYTEYLIRQNLGYVQPGEIEYRFIASPRPKSSRK